MGAVPGALFGGISGIFLPASSRFSESIGTKDPDMAKAN